MGIALYIDVRNRIFVTSFTNPLPYKFPPPVQGDGPEYDVYFVVPTGNPLAPFDYQNNTGAAVRMGITLPASRPSGGTFTLTFNAQTTAPINYNATATDVQTALEALNNIGAGNVTVTGGTGGPFKVLFKTALANTDVALITGSASLLTPEAFSVITSVITEGGGGNDEAQWIRIARNPLAENTDWTVGAAPGYAFSGQLDLDKPGIDALVEAVLKGTATLEVEIIRPGKRPDTIILQPVDVMNDGLESGGGATLTPGGAFLLGRAQPIALTVAAAQTNSNTVTVRHIRQGDQLVQSRPGDGLEYPNVKRWSVTENPTNPELNTLEVEIDAAPAAPITIYALAFINP